MLQSLLAIALAAAEPLLPPPPALAEPSAIPAAAAIRDTASAAGPRPAAPPPLSLPSAAPGVATFALPALALLALAAAAFLAARRQRTSSRLVQLLETTSLGPKRSLAVARVGDEILVLGVSEAGIQLLAARPADDAAPAEAVQPPAPAARPAPRPEPRRLRALSRHPAGPDDPGAGAQDGFGAASDADLAAESIRQAGLEAPAGRLRALFGRLTGRDLRATARPPPTFEALLAESAEDEELRRKLALGLAGSVR